MKTTPTKLILCISLFFVLFCNAAFYQHVVEIYPVTLKNIGFLVSLIISLTAVIVLLLSLLSSKYTTKPVIILLLLLSSLTAYFMDNYNVVIDHTMIQNIVQTNPSEVSDLLSLRLLYYIILLGLLPSLGVYFVKLEKTSWKRSAYLRLRNCFLSLLVIFSMVLLFSKFYTSFFREHKPLRYYTNPTYFIYSFGKYISKTLSHGGTDIHPLGEDAKIPESDTDRELIILVVGEAARSDRFSLNGYGKETNPLLKKEDVISFANMYSCGTSTAYSVPCMFSFFPRDTFSDAKGEENENLLDVLQHAGVHVLWRENNSDSKGVADRIPFQDYRKPEVNPVCDVECRDEGMLEGLQEYIDQQQKGDIFIVLHQMGNHGPAYYKRYPASFEIFTPVCRTNQFDECTNEEISNAYDNALVYTDYFLSRIIALLKNNTEKFEAAMIYLSDHGESLGEYGLYLHGLPYAIAPDPQKHIASIFWFGDSFKIDQAKLKNKFSEKFSQDNLFHTILGLLEVETKIYDKRLDMTSN